MNFHLPFTMNFQLPNDLPFLPERMKIGKVEELVANLYNKKEFKTSIKSWINI